MHSPYLRWSKPDSPNLTETVTQGIAMIGITERALAVSYRRVSTREQAEKWECSADRVPVAVLAP